MKKYILVYSIIIVTISLTVGFMVFQNYTYNRISNSIKVSENKYDFLESSNLLINNLRNLESYQRGYLLTNNQQFLEEYNKNKYQFNLEKERFYKLTSKYSLEKNSTQDVYELRKLIDEKVTELDFSIKNQVNGSTNKTIDSVSTNLGLNLMNHIVQITQKLNADNKYKETIAKQAIYKTRAQFKQVNFIFFSLLIICMLFLGFYIRKCINTDKPN